MGMYDSFIDKNFKCPKCKKLTLVDFQTKEIGCNLYSFKKGEKTIVEDEISKFIIKDGKYKVMSMCPWCHTFFDAIAVVENKIFKKITNVKTSKH